MIFPDPFFLKNAGRWFGDTVETRKVRKVSSPASPAFQKQILGILCCFLTKFYNIKGISKQGNSQGAHSLEGTNHSGNPSGTTTLVIGGKRGQKRSFHSFSWRGMEIFTFIILENFWPGWQIMLSHFVNFYAWFGHGNFKSMQRIVFLWFSAQSLNSNSFLNHIECSFFCTCTYILYLCSKTLHNKYEDNVLFS